jgi:feruloyl-CoA synthase
MKLAPLEGKLEARFRGPHVLAGYWRQPAHSATAFDEEGYFRSGDAFRFVDEANPGRGLAYVSRIAEDFKLSTGNFVCVGSLRARIIAEARGLVQDAVLAGADRDDIGALIFPSLDRCRDLAGLRAQAAAAEVLTAPAVRAAFQRLVDALSQQATGSSTRVARACLMIDPPSADHGEITDKGSINQRAVLNHRSELVAALYAGTLDGILRPAAPAVANGTGTHRGAAPVSAPDDRRLQEPR